MMNYIRNMIDEHTTKNCLKKMWQISKQFDNCLEKMKVLKENNEKADLGQVLVEIVSLVDDFNNKSHNLKEVDLEVWQKNGNRIKDRITLTLKDILDEYNQYKLLDNEKI